MKHSVVAIYNDSKHAGEAVGELKDMGYTKDISVVAKDVNAEGLETTDVKRDLGHEASRGASTGAVVGGVLGAIAGLLTGAATITVPPLGIAVIGPVVAAFTGAGVGGATGTLVGALIDMGVPDERAKEYEKYISEGQVLVAISAHPQDVGKIEDVLRKHQNMENAEADRVYHYEY